LRIPPVQTAKMEVLRFILEVLHQEAQLGFDMNF
jgi:hypothetical protein